MKPKIKWGVIGSGGIAKRRTIPEGIIPAENATLVSVYDVDQKANTETANEFIAISAKNLDDLLNTDIQAVYIASPVNHHIEHVLASAEAGKHVLCEKPLGLNVKEADRMVKACKRKNVKLSAGYMMRFHSQHLEVKKLLDAGKLGKPVFARAQLSCWYPKMEGSWRQDPKLGGGGSLIDMGSHCIDLLEMFFGHVKRLQCFTGNIYHDYEAEDSALVSMVFENGALGMVDTFFCIPDKSSKNALEIYGSSGSVLAHGTLGQGEAGTMTAFLEEEGTGYDAQQSRDDSDGIPVKPEPVNMYREEIEDISNAILEDQEPMNNADLAMHSQKIYEACYKSAKTGKVIDLNESIK